jgi:tetratricopeptide (TPR) repeat protein
MTKPGRHEQKPSDEIARFTDREDQRSLFHRHLNSASEPPVLMFYGIGGTGKTWLLKKLRQETPADVPAAYLDFDPQTGGQRFVADPAAALYEIRQQIGREAPRFDLAFAMLRHKQGAAAEPGLRGHGALGLAMEIAAEAAQAGAKFVPSVNVLLNRLSPLLLARVKGSGFERFLAGATGSQHVLELRAKTSQEIGADLLLYLAVDLRESLTPNLGRAVRAVLFFDTFEAVGAELLNAEHQRFREKWIRDAAANFDFALTVIAGQNRLDWAEAEPEWEENLEQHLVGGLSEMDARQFLGNYGIEGAELQEAILATARETDGGRYHCFSLGLCADIVYAERRSGREPEPETLRFGPWDWEALARRFLKSLASDGERRWIERLALTPRFDEPAGRAAFSLERSAAQDAEWEALHDYSFVQPLPGARGWFAIRAQMRWALENQPSAQERVADDHRWWREHWKARSASALDDAASLAWYHRYTLEPVRALTEWDRLAEAARGAVPPRMQEHFGLLRWWEPVGLLDSPLSSAEAARACNSLGVELVEASLGDRTANLRRAIECFEAAMRVYTEQDFPQDWAVTQNNLGNAWQNLPTGDRDANLHHAIECYEAALRVYTEQDFPQDWAMTQNNLGAAWRGLPTGDREANLRRAIECYEAALHVYTEQDFPQDWAMTQNNLGTAWGNLPSGDREANLRRAIDCFEATLRVHTEQAFPREWATTQNNLGIAWANLPTGDREANLRRAIECYEAALRVRTEQAFPQDWATSQNNLGNAWSALPTGDREANLRRTIECFEAALRVYTEQAFPREWATTQNNLGNAWADLPTGDREANLRRAIECYEAALRVFIEQDFPQDWAMTQNNLGTAWGDLPTGDREANLRRAIECYEAALRVRTEQDSPQDWAQTQNNLGNAWGGLPTGDREANLQRAIECYEAALRVRTERDFPQQWAITQDNLGTAWGDLPTGNRDANLRRAIECYEAALRVRTERAFPREHAETTANLRMAREALDRLGDGGGSSGDEEE